MSECKHVLQVPQLNGRVRCEKCNVWFDSWTHATEIVALNSRIAELEQQLAQARGKNIKLENDIQRMIHNHYHAPITPPGAE